MVSGLTSPYYYETVKGFVGEYVAVQTTAKTLHQGYLTHVYPDHIVLDICRVPFFIRTDEIVWITLGRKELHS